MALHLPQTVVTRTIGFVWVDTLRLMIHCNFTKRVIQTMTNTRSRLKICESLQAKSAKFNIVV